MVDKLLVFGAAGFYWLVALLLYFVVPGQQATAQNKVLSVPEEFFFKLSGTVERNPTAVILVGAIVTFSAVWVAQSDKRQESH